MYAPAPQAHRNDPLTALFRCWQADEAALDELDDVCVHLIDANIPDDQANSVELLRVAQMCLE